MFYYTQKGQNVTYYVAAINPMFHTTAVLVEKNGKGLLVDTQFSKEDSTALIALAKENGINIETVYISYSDPDYYFGLAHILDTFPKAKAYATAGTLARIRKTYEGKFAFWGPILKENAPDRIVIPEEISGAIQFEGETFQIFGSDPDRQVLFHAGDKVVLGGNTFVTDLHLFMADTKTLASKEQWIADLEEVKTLQPAVIIPAHFKNFVFTPDALDFTENYIKHFIEASKESQSSTQLIEKLRALYPGLDESNLEMSAKVETGEMEWN